MPSRISPISISPLTRRTISVLSLLIAAFTLVADASAEIYLTTHGLVVSDADERLAALLPDEVVYDDLGGPNVPLGAFLKLSPEDRNVVILKSANKAIHLQLEGEITIEDARLFGELSRLITSLDGQIIDISLDSPGGSVLAALDIARTIRRDDHFFEKYPTTSTLVYEGQCYSACVVIFAAGFYRDMSTRGPYGKLATPIGIHRPVFSEDELAHAGYDDISSAYIAVNRELRQFFESIHMGTKLVDDMFRIPSSDLRILTADEVEEYGLMGPDLVTQERRTALAKLHCGAPFEVFKTACEASLLPYCREVNDGDPFNKCERNIDGGFFGKGVGRYKLEQQLPTCIEKNDCAGQIYMNW